MPTTIAIYTIRADEFTAVLDRLPAPREETGSSGQIYQLADLSGRGGATRVALFRGVHQGNKEAHTLVQRAIEDLEPAWVLVVGIAGGRPHNDFTIGDVVVAAEYLDFAYEVKHDEGSQLHPQTLPLHRAAHSLVAALPAKLRQVPQWSTPARIGSPKPPPPVLAQIKDDVPPGYRTLLENTIGHHLRTPRTEPLALAGTIGSSESLQKSAAFMVKLLEGHRNLFCVEMESAGAHAACNAGGVVPLLTIRGISDIVGVDRTEDWTAYASKSAASLAVSLIELGAFGTAALEIAPGLATAPPIAPPSATLTYDPALAELSLLNIARYGDTDIFPRPFELGIFRDEPAGTLALLERIHSSFDEYFPRYPPDNASTLSTAGYSGFRWSSQLDPIYNAYFLSLVVGIASELEAVRVPQASRAVFSYRFDPDAESGRLFSDSIGWESFNEATQDLAANFEWVVRTDVTDFYPRISHQRLRSALASVTPGDTRVDRILSMLAQFSRGSGTGLPIGGPASRILAEAYLAASDHVLRETGVTFCRFVDDYVLFAQSENDAHRVLAHLAEVLGGNDSLSLQKLKTRMMRKAEFLRSYAHEQDADVDRESVSFLRLRLRYDPYSDTAEDDYNAIRNSLDGFDILGMLAREVRKSRLNQQLTKKLLHAGRFLPEDTVDSAVVTLAENLRSLLPVFASVAALLSSFVPRAKAEPREFLRRRLLSLLSEDESPPPLDLHRIAIVRLLAALGDLPETSRAFWEQYGRATNVLVKKECIWGLIRLQNVALLRTTLASFERSSGWERRALIAASHSIGSDGEAFRAAWKQSWSPFEDLTNRWCETREGSFFPGE